VLGAILSLLGGFAPAREHLEQGIALYDPKQHHALAFLYGLDPGVVCLSRVAGVWWQLGYPDQALKRSRAALTLAQELAHTHSLAFALSSASMHHLHRREWRVSQERAEALIALSREQGFAHFLTLGTIMRGGALIMQGQEEEGITQLRQVLAAERASVSAGRRVLVLMLLAEAQGKVGQAEEGLALLAEALAVADKLRPYEAEMYRLKGELTLKQSEVRGPRSEVDNPQSAFHNPQLDAEACFLKAIEVARRQQAKSLELRATVSLARLWQRQGKTTAAQQMLAEIYGWFTEGFDTADLQEAKALLEELA
ncbi:MAG: hypothetical protein HY268_04170, partial [Deltaproteobacteria bacterium]|nr:hypothetical protein [Deltaproteobacteria bacterium]